jgi:hypothetical protein
MRHERAWIGALALLLGAGCGGEAEKPADVSGMYTISLTKGDNGCMVADWKMGEVTNDVKLVLTQDMADPSKATAKLQGLSGLAVVLLFGTDTLTGTVTGNSFELRTLGGQARAMGSCSFEPGFKVSAKLTGDGVSGTVVAFFTTNGHADCGYRNQCSSVFAMSGSRPPKL